MDFSASISRMTERLSANLEIDPSFLLPPPAPMPPPLPLARYIDHTILRPEATAEDVARVCAEAREWGFCAVCVNPRWVRLAASELAGTGSAVCSVCGFPLGANLTGVKLREAELAIADGAAEIDLVIPIGLLRAGDYRGVLAELTEIRRATAGRVLKVILETGLLSEEEKIAGAILTRYAGADYVKTSTGFSGRGATVEDVALLRSAVGWAIGVKASGGIRDRATAEAMLAAGATRIGTSSGPAIMAPSGGGPAF